MTLGSWGEDKAAQYLQKQGYVIAERNYRSRIGEIDIIAQNDQELVFVEVKTRKSQTFGLPCEAVGHSKIRHLRRMAEWYMTVCSVGSMEARIDVIEILIVDDAPYLRHIRNITE